MHRRKECRGFYSITSSARASIVGGMVRPSAFAVLRLITSSNFVGCSTGMSLGLPPCKILITKDALRRNVSGPEAPYDINPPTSAKARGTVAAGKRCLSARSAMAFVEKLPCTTTAPAPAVLIAANALSISSGPRTTITGSISTLVSLPATWTCSMISCQEGSAPFPNAAMRCAVGSMSWYSVA